MESQLSFLKEIDKLKGVIRKTPLIDQSRRENSAEHSWHLAMYALVLADLADKAVDTNRVIRMLLLHDIVEIDAGDFPIHESDGDQGQQQLEELAAKRLFGLLPPDQAQELTELWQEFEAAETSDALFAKSLDRMQPLLHNVMTKGGTWAEADVTKDQVYERYGPVIAGGSSALWDKAKKLVDSHFKKI